jgi:potassium uptake Trk family protein
MPYFSFTATTGRNSLFMGLTSEQREELGGIEYRALKTLAKILIAYYVGFHILGMVVLLPWIRHTQPWKGVVTDAGQSPGWWGVFTPASMFNDLGFTLTADSMISFQGAVLPLLFGSFLIIIGNTGFPCMLRFIIWVLSKLVPYKSGVWEELRFLLDHPRRCFTLLFPSKATWWLFWVLILLNVVDLIFFIILDLNQPVVTDLGTPLRVLNGWFQATSTRTAGFASVTLSELHAGIQVSYMIMMYISVFPIAISIRRTNVYEEKSLGIFSGEEDGTGEDEEQSYVSQHLRRQLSFDLWYLFLGLFIIAIVEGDRISNTNEYAFTMFSVLFEIVSAYGTVGLSLGYPGINASFSAEFRVISKLVIIAMMLRGRHRGLPYALDRAILLPSEKLQQKEAEDAERRMVRRGSMFAEENRSQIRRGQTWEQGELDHSGLPRQHTGIDAAMTSGAGGNDPFSSPLRPVNTRRSTLAGSPASHRHARSRSLTRVIVGGLSAGPTYSKRD